MKEEDRQYTVYVHTTPNEKKYVGQTRNVPEKRWQNGGGYHHNEYFTRAIRKYGWENIDSEIVYENLTLEEANSREIELIELHRTTDSNKGFNFQSGGRNNRHRKETIENALYSTINYEKAKEIRNIYRQGKTTQEELSLKYNISRRSIGDVITNKTWYDKNYEVYTIQTNEKTANLLRKEYSTGKYTQLYLSKKYNVHKNVVSSIIRNDRWRDESYTPPENNKGKIDMVIANEIRKIYKDGNHSQRKLAKVYNVSQSCIGNILNYKTWNDRGKNGKVR